MDSSLVKWFKGAAILITCSKAQAAHEAFVIVSATRAGTRDLRGSIWRSWMRTGSGGGIQAQELLVIVSVSGSIVDCNEVFYTWYKYCRLVCISPIVGSDKLAAFNLELRIRV
jgi:hypothetical protein